MQPSLTLSSHVNGTGTSLEDVLPLLKQVKPDGKGGYTALCPAHPDRNPSLSIRRGDRQGVVTTCRSRNCSHSDILAAIGIAPERSSLPVTNYDYTDENGVVLYRAVRLTRQSGEKDFRAQSPDGRGSWQYKLPHDVRRVPYNLPTLIEAISEGKRVYVVEGEKDVETAGEYGLVATTNIFGAGKWTDGLSSYFQDADVVVIPDNDKPGLEHAQQVARLLDGIAASVRVLDPLPGVGPKGDLSDWMCEGHSLEELDRLVGGAPEWSQSVATAAPRIRLFDDEEIQSVPEPEWLASGVFPGNALAQLFGPSESMKTFVALDLACHIATGLEWHGRRVVRGNVVYVMAEGIHGAKHRVAAWKKYHGISGKIGLYFVRHRIEVIPESTDLVELCQAIALQLPAKPALIVLDTLARNMKGNENATEDMNVFIAGCDSLRQQTEATVLVVHHTGWTETERSRGNSSNHCAMDTDILTVRDGDRVTLKCRKQKDAAHFPDLAFEALPVGKSLVLKPMDQTGGKLDGNRLLCLQVVHRSEGGLTHSQWIKESELTKKKSSFNDARSWLVTQTYVVKGAEKKYRATEAGIQALGPRTTLGPSVVHESPGQLVHDAGGSITPAMDLGPSEAA